MKNRRSMFSEGNNAQCPSSPVSQPPADSNGHLACLSFDKTCTIRPLLSAEGCHTLPDPSAEVFAEGKRAVKAVQAL
jgi:hypothetical protein